MHRRQIIKDIQRIKREKAQIFYKKKSKESHHNTTKHGTKWGPVDSDKQTCKSGTNQELDIMGKGVTFVKMVETLCSD